MVAGRDPSLIRRKAALTLVDYALHTVNVVSMAPLLFDHLALDVTADRSSARSWTAAARSRASGGASQTRRRHRTDRSYGSAIMRLLSLSSRRVGYGRIGQKRNQQSVASVCWTLPANRRGAIPLRLEPGEGIAQRLIAATGQADYRPGRLLGHMTRSWAASRASVSTYLLRALLLLSPVRTPVHVPTSPR